MFIINNVFKAFMSNAAQKLQFRILTILLIVVLVFTVILNITIPEIFQRFFGKLNPIIVILVSSIFGFLSLFYLSKYWRFNIYDKINLKELIRFFLLLVIFVSAAIFIDLNFVFPVDMNILFPESILFYPTIAFFVEIVFHVLPFGLLLITLNTIFKTIPFKKLVWVCIIIVALFEPTYQIYFDSYPIWVTVTIWLNLFLFNITQLVIFERYNFIAMYVYRLLYYLFWHIIWGSFRLELLF